MKKMKLFSFLLILLFFNSKIYSDTISNKAYLITSNFEKVSNEVKIEIIKKDIFFKEHFTNVKEQMLTEENKIMVVAELDLRNFDTSFFYFKKNIYSTFYPTTTNFFIQEEGSDEQIELEKELNNPLQTKLIEIKGGKKYKVISYGIDLKNTTNLKEGYFSLEAFKDKKSLGEIKNTLLIENSLFISPSSDNEEVQYLNSSGEITTKMNIIFKNLLREKIRLRMKYSNEIYINQIEGMLGDQLIKFYWNESDKSFYSDEILIVGEATVTIVGTGVKAINNSKSALFTLLALIGNVDYGSVTNKIILESQNRILLEKKSKQKSVRVGDLLKYSIDVTISKEDKFKKFIFEDFLPRGFELIEKSIKTSDGRIYNIQKKSGNRFSFEIYFDQKDLKEKDLTIEYIVRIGVTSKHGKNINRAIIYGDNLINPIIESNLASATVDVDTENFSEKGIIVGIVYLDLNRDKNYNNDVDVAIPGIKIFLENGDFAITDENGKYSIYGEDATTHIAKVDKKSLLKGIQGVKLTAKHSKNGESQFIDLKKAQLYSANFAFNIDSKEERKEIFQKIEKRREVLKDKVKEYIYNVENKELSFKGASSINEREELGEIGTINNLEIVKFEKENTFLMKDKNEIKEKVVIENLREKYKILTAEEITSTIEEMNNSLDIINISNGDIVPENMTFQIKGPIGGSINLYINEKKVDLSHIGMSASSSLNSLFFLEYSSVKLEKGKNIIKATFLDPFGIERDYIKKEVLVRGELSKVVFEKLPETDDKEEGIARFSIKGTDDNGLDVPHSLNATIIESGGGEWLTPDFNEDAQGLQIMIPANKESIVEFKAKAGKQNIKFKIKLENIEKDFEFNLHGKTQELFVNGILEGRFNLKGNKSENFFFEKKINNLYNKLYYRGAGFVQGHIKDKYYLTMTYDSAKENEKFFGYEDPDDYYPIYGDNSIKGYIGESREDLFIKIEKSESYIMYGDYKTSKMFDDRLRLNQYARTLTGFSSEINEEKIGVNTFVAKTSSNKILEELEGEGISGPYSLSNRDIIEGSEEITLKTYDKNNGNIISEIILARGQDYSIDYDLGRIYFSEPIMSYDLEFNPIFIKVNYEIENESGQKHWVYGTNMEYQIKDKIIIGGSYVKDESPIQEYDMKGIYALYDDEKNLIIIETSQTNDFEEGIGEGKSIYYKYEVDNLKVTAIFEKSDTNYSNPDSKLSPGIERVDIESEYQFESKNILKLESEFLKDESEGDGYQKRDVYLGLELAKKGDFVYEVGAKHYYRSQTLEQGEVNTIAAKITWEPEEYSFLKMFLEYEQDILLSNKKRIATGIDYSVSEETVVYLRQELVANLDDESYLDPEDDSNRTLIGVKTKSYLSSEIFSEYREKNEDGQILPELGYGLKKEFEINQNLLIYGTFERIDPVIKNNGDELKSEQKSATAITIGYDYEIDSISRIKGDFEFEFGKEKSFLNKLGYGRKINDSLYFIGKNRYYNEEEEKENRLILGLAYREFEDSKYNSLNKYEINYSKNIIDDNYRQITNIFRSSHNYTFNSDFDATLTLGMKNINTTYEDIKSNYTAYLIATNLNYNIYNNWTTGINISTIFDNDKNADYGIGFEVGHIFENSLWLSLGYNFIGFKDKDFDPTGELNKGLYIRFRMNIGDIFDKTKNSRK